MRLWAIAAIATTLGVSAQPAFAQGKGRGRGNGGDDKPSAAAEHKGPKKYRVKTDRAIVVTRDVLVRQGFLVERVEEGPEVTVVWYRRGNMGNGVGKGPVEKMVIRRTNDVVVFEQAPPAVLVDIDLRLRL
jgi:hypothetical protein